MYKEKWRNTFQERPGMLRITSTVLSQQETALRLDGRVAGQWVALLRESAESALAEGLKLTIDLKNISYIDCGGINHMCQFAFRLT